MKMTKITLPPDLSYWKYDDFYHYAYDSVKSDVEKITIECYQARFADIYSILGLLLFANYFSRKGIQFEWHIPKGNFRSFLGRVNFFQSLLSNSSVLPELDTDWITQQSNFHGLSKSLLELVPIQSEDNIQEILLRSEEILREELGYIKRDALDICIMLSEVCHNIIDHNSEDVIGYASMQYYRPSSTNPFLQISVGDSGIGIPVSLRKNPRYSGIIEDRSVIEKSLQLNVSEFEEEFGRGQGLYRLCNLCAKHQGTMMIRSGSGKVYQRYYSDSKKKSHSFEQTYMPGTLIGMNFEMNSNIVSNRSCNS